MQHRKDRNSEKPFNRHNLEMILPDLPEDVQALWAHTNAQDERDQTQFELDFAAKEKARKALEHAEFELSQARGDLASPTAKLNQKALERRVRAKELARDNAVKRLNAIKTKTKAERMHSSRIGAGLAAIRTPQRHTALDLPPQYKKADALAAIAMVRSEIEARYSRIAELYRAILPFDEALARYKASAQRLAKETTGDRVQFREFGTVHEGVGGQFKLEPVSLPPEIIAEACLGFVLAYGENKLRKMYDAVEQQAEFDEGGIEILSLSDRKHERAELEAEIAELHRIEGYLTRRAIAEGHSDLAINPDLPVSALLGLEDDPDAPVEESKPQFEEVPGDTSPRYAQLVN